MGKEWLYWVGGGGGGGGSATRRRRSMSGEIKDAAEATSAGCMCAVFQLFDLHHFQLPLNQQNHPSNGNSFLHEEATSPKGVEAPRNSLELDEPASIKAPSAMKEEENLNFPVGIQIKTSHGKISSSSPRVSRTEDFSSECSSNSPGIKTPNLVARLMGLDLLPETTSPSLTSSKSQLKSHFHQKNQRNFRGNAFFDDDISVGARSLPETPRISSSSRKSDVEYHHRLSLQVNKDEEIGFRKGRRFRHDNENNRSIGSSSPGHYARQIVKQVKESVSRRVGLSDITNRNKDEIIRRDENLILLKPTKKNIISGSKIPKISSSDDDHHNHNHNHNHNHRSQGIVINRQQENQQHQQQQQQRKCISSSSGAKKLPHQARDKAIRKKKEEQFVRSKATKKEKKSKKTLLSSDIITISGPTVLQVKKDPSPPPTKLPQKQPQAQVSDALSSKRSTQLSCNPSHSYNNPHKIFTLPPDNTNGCATPTPGGAAAAYGNYIQKILKRTGIIENVTVFTSIKWHTPSHPIDPSVFYYLELFHPSATTYAAVHGGRNPTLSHRCNRKLIFQLVDELLAEILKPHFNFKPRVSPFTEENHFSLFDQLCEKIDNFPAADCRVLEDIDSLIDTDLCTYRLNGFFEEEWESIVCEIEGGIMEALLSETAAAVGGRTTEEYRQRLTGVTW